MTDTQEPEKKIEEAVPTKPEETTPTPEAPPAVTPPAEGGDNVREAINSLSSRVDELAGIVTGVIATANVASDSTPVRRPWTHWGSK